MLASTIGWSYRMRVYAAVVATILGLGLSACRSSGRGASSSIWTKSAASGSGSSATKYRNGDAAALAACLPFLDFHDRLVRGAVLTTAEIAHMRQGLAPMKPAAHEAARLDPKYQTLSADADEAMAYVDAADFSSTGPSPEEILAAPPIAAMLNDCMSLEDPASK